MAADAAQYPRRDTLSIEQGRANAEKVRLPWAQGGPAMARTEEHLSLIHISASGSARRWRWRCAPSC